MYGISVQELRTTITRAQMKSVWRLELFEERTQLSQQRRRQGSGIEQAADVLPYLLAQIWYVSLKCSNLQAADVLLHVHTPIYKSEM